MDKFSEEVRRGVEEIRTGQHAPGAIIHQVQTLTPRFQTVNEGMHAQATGAQQISETLTQLSEAPNKQPNRCDNPTRRLNSDMALREVCRPASQGSSFRISLCRILFQELTKAPSPLRSAGALHR